MDATYPFSLLVKQLAGPSFTAVLHDLWLPQNLACDFFRHTSHLVGETLESVRRVNTYMPSYVRIRAHRAEWVIGP